jgi:uncharacterized membrane protein YjdF
MADDRRFRFPRADQVARIVQLILFVTLVGSVVYTAVHLSWAPDASADPGVRVRSDYVLMLIQCAGGLVVMFLPAIVHRRLAISVPSTMQIAYFVFLYGAIYLGEVRSFYYGFAFWDSLLHFFSGVMLGALGFFLVQLLNDAERRKVTLSATFVAFFAFCFAVTCGAMWEIYEFAIDGLFGTNMQKVITDTGTVLAGRDALTDTMTDLILDTVAALVVSVVGYFLLRRAERSGQPPRSLLVGLRPETI